jgi:hypothetical protein
MKQQVADVEKKVETMEDNFNNHSMIIYKLLQNICSTMLDPVGTQDDKWIDYWRHQAKKLSELIVPYSTKLQ